MHNTSRLHRVLTAGVVVYLTPAERAQLRHVLFDKGGISMQAFFRQLALAEIRAAQAQGRGPDDGGNDDVAA